MSGYRFLFNQGEMNTLHEDDIEPTDQDREEYLQYLGKDYTNYINGLQEYNNKFNRMGGFRRDVINFFIHLDDIKKKELIIYIADTNPKLYQLLNADTYDQESIESQLVHMIEENSKELENITGIV